MGEYYIHEFNFEKFDKKAKRILNKCKKLGLPFAYDVLGEEYVTNEIGGEEITQKYIKVEVFGRAFISDYEAVAVAECHDNNKNIVKKINKDSGIEIPVRFFSSGCACEHCQKNAVRKEVIIIRNVNTGEFKQVGKACCKLYTGNLDAATVAMMYEFFEDVETEQFDGFSSSYKRYYDVEEVIATAAELIDVVGYFSSGNNYGLTTKYLLSLALHREYDRINKDLKSAKIDVSVGKFDFGKADTDERVAAIMEYYKSLEQNSDFLRNVNILFDDKYVDEKNIGYLAYLPVGYDKYILKKKEAEKRKARAAAAKYFGEVGKRYKDIPVAEVKDIASYETMYGVTTVYKILLESGDMLTWKTSGGLVSSFDSYIDKVVRDTVKKKYKWKDVVDFYYDSDRYFEAFAVEKVTFTVKEHSEYRNEKQTLVQRCSFTFRPTQSCELKIRIIQKDCDKVEEVIKFTADKTLNEEKHVGFFDSFAIFAILDEE